MNMKLWIESIIRSEKKKPMPILSFPGIQHMGIDVERLVRSSDYQSQCMEVIAEKFSSAMSVSLMDLSVEAEAFGCHVHYESNEVPTVDEPLLTPDSEATSLTVPEIGAGRTGICVNAIKKAVEKITDRPVIAGMIGPFSLAGRLFDMTELMYICYDDEEMLYQILEKNTEFLINYAKAFKKAGANGIMIAEPAAGLLSSEFIKKFSIPYIQKIREAVEDSEFLIIYHNCGNVKPVLKDLQQMHANAYSFGNSADMLAVLEEMPEDSLILGNLDPSSVFVKGTPESVRLEALALLKECSGYSNFVISSGCDIPPQTPMKNIEAFFGAVKDYYEGK